MGHFYHIPCPQVSGIMVESGTESLTEPEAVYVFNKTVFAGHDRDIANMNVKQL